MEWNEIKDKIYRWDGSWRDIYILGTTIDDWRLWINFVNRAEKIRWVNPLSSINEAQIQFEVIAPYLQLEQFSGSTVSFWIAPTIQVNSHFFEVGKIENDIDPREVCSVNDHIAVINYMKSVYYLLGKEVILTDENHESHVLVKVNESVEYTSNG